MTTITNNFHNTEYQTARFPQQIQKIIKTNPIHWTGLEKTFVQRCRRMLCGIKGCTCGGLLGERGPQEWAKHL